MQHDPAQLGFYARRLPSKKHRRLAALVVVTLTARWTDFFDTALYLNLGYLVVLVIGTNVRDKKRKTAAFTVKTPIGVTHSSADYTTLRDRGNFGLSGLLETTFRPLPRSFPTIPVSQNCDVKSGSFQENAYALPRLMNAVNTSGFFFLSHISE